MEWEKLAAIAGSEPKIDVLLQGVEARYESEYIYISGMADINCGRTSISAVLVDRDDGMSKTAKSQDFDGGILDVAPGRLLGSSEWAVSLRSLWLECIWSNLRRRA